MRILFFVLLLFGTSIQTVTAQSSQYNTAKDSDPGAIALVQKLRNKYDNFRTLQADFRLDIQLPGQAVESQRGTLSRQGDLVRFRLGPQEGIINAEAAYLVQHDNKEVMISDLPEEGEQTGILTPQTLFNFYESDNYVLSLRGEETVDGRVVKVIELKPLNRDESEFTKLRLLADARKLEIVSVRAFTRDGANFTFTLGAMRGNLDLAAKTFVFDKADFPGYYVEDLRY